MVIRTIDYSSMITSIRDTIGLHNEDVKVWSKGALHRYVSRDIKLHEVELLSRLHECKNKSITDVAHIHILLGVAKNQGYL